MWPLVPGVSDGLSGFTQERDGMQLAAERLAAALQHGGETSKRPGGAIGVDRTPPVRGDSRRRAAGLGVFAASLRPQVGLEVSSMLLRTLGGYVLVRGFGGRYSCMLVVWCGWRCFPRAQNSIVAHETNEVLDCWEARALRS